MIYGDLKITCMFLGTQGFSVSCVNGKVEREPFICLKNDGQRGIRLHKKQRAFVRESFVSDAKSKEGVFVNPDIRKTC